MRERNRPFAGFWRNSSVVPIIIHHPGPHVNPLPDAENNRIICIFSIAPMGNCPLTPAEIKQAQQSLGLSVADLARLLDTDAQTIRRMEQRDDASTFRRPAPRMARLIEAYLAGYRHPIYPSTPHQQAGSAAHP